MSVSTATVERPPGVPTGARRVTLAQLRDDVAKDNGSLRLGPRGSYLRFQMRLFPWVLMGTVRAVLGGGINTDHGERSFALEYANGVRRPGNWKIMAFTQPGWADHFLWIWTLDDVEADRQARLAAKAARA